MQVAERKKCRKVSVPVSECERLSVFPAVLLCIRVRALAWKSTRPLMM